MFLIEHRRSLILQLFRETSLGFHELRNHIVLVCFLKAFLVKYNAGTDLNLMLIPQFVRDVLYECRLSTLEVLVE